MFRLLDRRTKHVETADVDLRFLVLAESAIKFLGIVFGQLLNASHSEYLEVFHRSWTHAAQIFECSHTQASSTPAPASKSSIFRYRSEVTL